LAELKPFLVDTLAKVDGVLPEPVPEALVIDLGDADARVAKLRLTWWTKNPRQHEMVASHDRVLTAIREALQPRVDKPSPNLEARAA
jgi:small conductance mechanosensitive channel